MVMVRPAATDLLTKSQNSIAMGASEAIGYLTILRSPFISDLWMSGGSLYLPVREV
jgi:hypothetical protein